jgi:hypothetical protein
MTFGGVKQIAENRPQFLAGSRVRFRCPKKLMIAVIADLACGGWS